MTLRDVSGIKLSFWISKIPPVAAKSFRSTFIQGAVLWSSKILKISVVFFCVRVNLSQKY